MEKKKNSLRMTKVSGIWNLKTMINYVLKKLDIA